MSEIRANKNNGLGISPNRDYDLIEANKIIRRGNSQKTLFSDSK